MKLLLIIDLKMDCRVFIVVMTLIIGFLILQIIKQLLEYKRTNNRIKKELQSEKDVLQQTKDIYNKRKTELENEYKQKLNSPYLETLKWLIQNEDDKEKVIGLKKELKDLYKTNKD